MRRAPMLLALLAALLLSASAQTVANFEQCVYQGSKDWLRSNGRNPDGFYMDIK